jgi:hypothetical protein
MNIKPALLPIRLMRNAWVVYFAGAEKLKSLFIQLQNRASILSTSIIRNICLKCSVCRVFCLSIGDYRMYRVSNNNYFSWQ